MSSFTLGFTLCTVYSIEFWQMYKWHVSTLIVLQFHCSNYLLWVSSPQPPCKNIYVLNYGAPQTPCKCYIITVKESHYVSNIWKKMSSEKHVVLKFWTQDCNVDLYWLPLDIISQLTVQDWDPDSQDRKFQLSGMERAICSPTQFVALIVQMKGYWLARENDRTFKNRECWYRLLLNQNCARHQVGLRTVRVGLGHHPETILSPKQDTASPESVQDFFNVVFLFSSYFHKQGYATC